VKWLLPAMEATEAAQESAGGGAVGSLVLHAKTCGGGLVV
jgi:hypothetical protein